MDTLTLVGIIMFSIPLHAIILILMGVWEETSYRDVILSQFVTTGLVVLLAFLVSGLNLDTPKPDCSKYEYGSQSRLVCQVDWLYTIKGGE